jgi:hypothetical protein
MMSSQTLRVHTNTDQMIKKRVGADDISTKTMAPGQHNEDKRLSVITLSLEFADL